MRLPGDLASNAELFGIGFIGNDAGWRSVSAIKDRHPLPQANDRLRRVDSTSPKGHAGVVQRVVVLGRGGAGKTTAATQLGELLNLPVIELDQLFWSAELTPTPPEAWSCLQADLAAAEGWVMDGDLGPYDVLQARLVRADTVLLLDFGLPRCLWRAARRSREGLNFWRWVITWRHCARPALLTAVAKYAPSADLHTVQTPRQLHRLLNSLRD